MRQKTIPISIAIPANETAISAAYLTIPGCPYIDGGTTKSIPNKIAARTSDANAYNRLFEGFAIRMPPIMLVKKKMSIT